MPDQTTTAADDQHHDHAERVERARRAAIDTLTSAARLRRPDGRPLDFAELVAAVLASGAANVGGVDQPSTGRTRRRARPLPGVLSGRDAAWHADGGRPEERPP